MAVIPLGRTRKPDPRWRRWVQASVACGLAVTGGSGASAGDPVFTAAPALFTAVPVTHVSGAVEAPPFELATADGQTVALAALKGKVMLLNFWATWCPPCREEMPSMERLHQAFKEQGLAVLAVNIQESPKQVSRFMRDFRLTFPALLDGGGKVTSQYGARALPSTYLVDRNGRLVAQAIGARDWAGSPAQALIRALLAPTTARP